MRIYLRQVGWLDGAILKGEHEELLLGVPRANLWSGIAFVGLAL